MSLRSALPMLLRSAAQKPAAMMMMGSHAAPAGAIAASSSLMQAILPGDSPLASPFQLAMPASGIAFPSRGFASSADEKAIPLGAPTEHAGVQMHGVRNCLEHRTAGIQGFLGHTIL